MGAVGGFADAQVAIAHRSLDLIACDDLRAYGARPAIEAFDGLGIEPT